ncbi:MAG: VCBS repeat-containing protein [Alphaproteobacteria bacterium]|nr:VCBS repeat-containing protein [Alphaproteobacteria bacterium]
MSGLVHKGALVAALSFAGGLWRDRALPPEPPEPAEVAAPAPFVGPEAVQEPLVEGGPTPTLLVPQAWFYKDEKGRPTPGPARLQIWQQTPEGWVARRLEDPDSNVFHEAWIDEAGGIVTLGAEGAHLKRWTYAEGAWSQETLWTRRWGGKFNRLREMERGDVDQDGQEEWVIATHDLGVVAVFDPETRAAVELDPKPDTFVHEVEIGDVDGDGQVEFFATVTPRNTLGGAQSGEVVMYRWDGAGYARSVVAQHEGRRAREILVTDLDGEGVGALIAVLEPAQDAAHVLTSPLELVRYSPDGAGGFEASVLAAFEVRAARFLVPGDFDRDGQVELVLTTMQRGVWLLDRDAEGAWQQRQLDAQSSGFEHAAAALDLDGDGFPELYVTADDQQELRRYTWSAAGEVQREVLGALPAASFSWNLASGRL